ncbi:MAG: hypothetical protein ACOY3D_01650 [Candidatus Omnitrophota bacterium]
MSKIRYFFCALFLFCLAGCVTSRNRSVDIPVANVTAVYEPPNTRVITLEIIAIIFILALALYLVLEKLLRRKPKGQQ